MISYMGHPPLSCATGPCSPYRRINSVEHWNTEQGSAYCRRNPELVGTDDTRSPLFCSNSKVELRDPQVKDLSGELVATPGELAKAMDPHGSTLVHLGPRVLFGHLEVQRGAAPQLWQGPKAGFAAQSPMHLPQLASSRMSRSGEPLGGYTPFICCSKPACRTWHRWQETHDWSGRF